MKLLTQQEESEILEEFFFDLWYSHFDRYYLLTPSWKKEREQLFYSIRTIGMERAIEILKTHPHFYQLNIPSSLDSHLENINWYSEEEHLVLLQSEELEPIISLIERLKYELAN